MQISALAHAASDALPTALVHDQSETAAARACAHQIADAWRFYKELKNAAMQRPTMKALGRVG